MSHPQKYTAEAIAGHSGISDIRITMNGKTWHLWGRKGGEREKDLAATMPADQLPVLIGSGLGAAIQFFVNQNRPVAVIDKEAPILEQTKLKTRFASNKLVTWIDANTPQTAFDKVLQWKSQNGNVALYPIAIPLYLRLEREYYGTLATTIKSAPKADFWSQARYPKFRKNSPRVLFLDSSYFLCGEILSSLKRMEIKHRSLKLDRGPTGSQEFVEQLLREVMDFKPDFVLTVNHFGMDRNGKLATLLKDLDLPLASWFVDNPHLILHDYAHPGTDNTAIFTYDASNLDLMRKKGFEHIHFLPLATDPQRFVPGVNTTAPQSWHSDVSFVGNSMITPAENALNDASLPTKMRGEYETVAAEFGESGALNVRDFLEKDRPDWFSYLCSEKSTEKRLALESLLTWEATRQYRHACIRGILPYAPLIVGDDGWQELIQMGYWRHLAPIDYYADLPRFYPCSKINFNCTSRQMIGAVNQRVFDVPACGAFVLTDYREQMEDLFDLNSEVVVYRNTDEIPDLADRYLKDTDARQKIIRNARKRIRSQHTYKLRLKELFSIMRKTFS